MHTTLVCYNGAAVLLKFLTEVAHTPVSTLGNILRIRTELVKSDRDLVDKSTVFRLKSGALEPTDGSSPIVCVGVPPKVIDAIFLVFNDYKI